LTKEQYAHAVARWQELGMHGVPPSLRFFDDLTVKAAAAGK
jgi:hypothetical protein